MIHRQVTISRHLAEDILKWLDELADVNSDPAIMATICSLVYRMEREAAELVPERSGNIEQNQMGEAW